MLFGVDLEVQDVRSGYRNSCRLFLQAEWLSTRQLSWTRDMVCEIHPERLEEIQPPSRLKWPAFSDERIIGYLAQHYRPRIWRNLPLGMYAHPGETKSEFLARCRDRLRDERAEEQRKLWDIFVRRFLELEQRFLSGSLHKEEKDPEWKKAGAERFRDLLSRQREQLWSLRDQFQPSQSPAFAAAPSDPFVVERSVQLLQDLTKSCAEIEQFYEASAREIDCYQVTVNHPQMEVVSRGIMWSPMLNEMEN